MKLCGISWSTNALGNRSYTLHVEYEFDSYYDNSEAGRGCRGVAVETIYAGDIDCSALSVGMQIEVLYGKAITTKNGAFQPVKRIDIVE